MNIDKVKAELLKMVSMDSFANIFRTLAVNEYIAGLQGQSPLYQSLSNDLLPSGGKIPRAMESLYSVLETANIAGQSNGSYRLPFSDMYITPNGITKKFIKEQLN